MRRCLRKSQAAAIPGAAAPGNSSPPHRRGVELKRRAARPDRVRHSQSRGSLRPNRFGGSEATPQTLREPTVTARRSIPTVCLQSRQRILRTDFGTNEKTPGLSVGRPLVYEALFGAGYVYAGAAQNSVQKQHTERFPGFPYAPRMQAVKATGDSKGLRFAANLIHRRGKSLKRSFSQTAFLV